MPYILIIGLLFLLSRTTAGAFTWPVKNFRLIGKFGNRDEVGTETGILLELSQPTVPVYAMADGIIHSYWTDNTNKRGLTLRIIHPGDYSVTMAHLKQNNLLPSNTKVTKGQIIGYAGSHPGNPSGKFYLSVRKLNTPIDPLTILPKI